MKLNKSHLFKSTIALTLISSCVFAQKGALTSIEQKVVSDQQLMVNMTAQERRDYRKVIWNNSDKQAQQAYNRAYKNLMEAGVIGNLPKVAGEETVKKTKAQRIPGTSITYHSGTLSPATVNSVAVGNRFNSALNPAGTAVAPLEASGSITMATFNMAAADANVFISFYDQISGTMANRITSFATPGVTGDNTLTFATALNYVGGEFLGGIWNFTGGNDTVNVATGTVGGQGFHGISINDSDPGTDLVEFTMTNGAFGVSGDVTTPVELMNFEID